MTFLTNLIDLSFHPLNFIMKDIIKFFFGLLCLFFLGCPVNNGDNNTADDNTTDDSVEIPIIDSAYVHLPFSMDIEFVRFEVDGEDVFFEDDIYLGKLTEIKRQSDILEKKVKASPQRYAYLTDPNAALPQPSITYSNIANGIFNGRTWEGGEVPYDFAQNVSSTQKEAIETALLGFNAVCGLNIRPRMESEDPSFIRFRVTPKSKKAAWSEAVGKKGGKQFITIAEFLFDPGHENVFKNAVIHEVMHALGFRHEHTRPDRDDHIIVNMRCIPVFKRGNYFINIFHPVTMYGAYDIQSVMQYKSRDFDDSPTSTCYNITDLNDAPIVLPNFSNISDHLSSGDKEALNYLYPCPPGNGNGNGGSTCAGGAMQRPCRFFETTGKITSGVLPKKVETPNVSRGTCVRVRVTKTGGHGAGKIWLRGKGAESQPWGFPELFFAKNEANGNSKDFVIEGAYNQEIIFRVGCPTTGKKFEYEVCMTELNVAN